ncbi:MAG: riboflavin synthase [Gammaproteobacteria bacterium]|jgi:riboflavin synthase
MFAGIVKGVGRIVESIERDGDRRLVIATAGVDLGTVTAGDSISVNGVCLTAVEPEADAFAADVSAATLACTTLGGLGPGAAVNLEPSLSLGDQIAGHLVYGHVDAVGRVVDLSREARSVALTIAIPESLSRYVAVKGSVTVDGVSLTVNAAERDRFTVNIIPHTREVTVIAGYGSGTPVNIEVDMIARYLERLIAADAGNLSLDMLKRHGFIESD